MNEDRLRQLLHEADRHVAPPPSSGDLAGRVWGMNRRWQRTTAIGAAAALLLIAIGTSYWMLAGRSQGPSLAGNDSPSINARSESEVVARLRAEMERLTAEADERANRLNRFLAALDTQRVLAESRRDLQLTDPLAQAHRQTDLAARAIVFQANQFQHKLNMPRSAASAYRRVADLFPQSYWAQVARQQLERIERTQGDLL